MDALHLLWKRKFWILAAIILGASLGVVRAILQPPLYRSDAMIELRGLNERFMGLNQVNPEADGGNAGNVQAQTYILTGTTMRQRVLDRLNLELTPLTYNPDTYFGKLRNRLGLATAEPVAAMREALTAASRTLEARPVGATRLIQISAKSTSPDVAASFVNAVAAEYSSQALQARSTNAIRTIQWIEGQLEETRSRLDEAEGTLQDFLAKSGVDFVADSNTLDRSKLAHLQGELSAIQTDRIEKQARWDLAQSSPVDSIPEILDDGRLRDLKTHLVELREERARLAATLMPEHYKMKLLDAQISELESTLTEEKSNLVRSIRNEYDAAAQRERMLSQAYQRQAQQIAGKADTAAQYGGLMREVETTQKVYDLLLEQLNTAYLAAAVPTETVGIVEQGKPIDIVVEPNPTRDVVLGACLGGGGVFGLFFFFESRRQKKLSKLFVTPRNIVESLDTAELGVIPSIPKARRLTRLLNRASAKGRSFQGAQIRLTTGGSVRKAQVRLIRSQTDSTVRPELVAWQRQPSLLAESFRLTVASLLRNQGLSSKPVIVVTSPGPGEGKTTVISNLAIAMTQTGRRVLLIDGDWRKPRLQDAFRVSGEPGIVDWLDATPQDGLSLNDCLRETEIPGLTLMPAGRGTGDMAGQIVFSDKIEGLLKDLRAGYDVVLIDTAPAMHFADARLLGRLSGGIVLVVRAGATFREGAQRLQEQFRADGIPLIGTILNDWSPEEGQDPDYASQYRAYVDSRDA